jgi:hypothetical protein
MLVPTQHSFWRRYSNRKALAERERGLRPEVRRLLDDIPRCAGADELSAIPAERDFVEHVGAEFLRRGGDGRAQQLAVEFDRCVVLRQRPHDQRFQSALGEIAARGGERPSTILRW